MSNVRVENSFNGRSCINLSTARFATATVTLAANPNIGDNLTIGGVLFAAIANGSIPAANQFEIGEDVEETVENLVSAILDPLNGLDSQVVPSGSLNVLTLRSFEPGIVGNLITLSSSVPLILVVSGPTFTGGLDNSNNSTVAYYLAEFLDCDLVATGLNGYQIRAQAVNNIKVRGGDWTDSGSSTSFVDIREVALFDLEGVTAQIVGVYYDSAAVNKPNIPTSSYRIREIEVQSQFSSDLDGVGSLEVEYSNLENLLLSGTQSPVFRYCSMQDIVLGDTVSLTLSQCDRGTLSGLATATCKETTTIGSLVFNVSNQETFTFGVPNPDTNYQVFVEIASSNVPFVPEANKTVSDFTVDFSAPFTGTVNFMVKRDI